MSKSARSIRSMKSFVLRRGDQIAAVVLLLVYVGFAASAISLERGTLMQPGPGLWPVALSVAGGVLSVILFVTGREVPILAKKGTLRTLTVTLGSMSIMPIGYTLVGFIPSAALSLFLMIYLLGQYKWHISLTTAAIGSSAVYLLFAIGLALPISAF